MASVVAITGCSVLTPLDGAGRSTWEALVRGEKVGARVAVAEEMLTGDAGVDRSVRLAHAAVRRLEDLPKEAGIFCGTSKGPVGVFLEGIERVRKGEGLTEMQALQVAYGVGAMGTMLQQRLGTRGVVHTSVAACASGMHALHRAAKAVERGECEKAIVVAADASLHPLFDASFERLGVLSPRGEDGVTRCEPFGEEGTGFFLIEAAAALLLERKVAGAKGVQAWVEETWVGGDGTGLIAVDAETRGLREGLKRVCGEEGLAFVHAHATGTGHDAYELAAIRGCIGGEVPVFSHKGWLGHSLGAAGLLGVALSVMGHREGRLPGGDRVEAGRDSLTIAQGFGGNLGVVRLRGV